MNNTENKLRDEINSLKKQMNNTKTNNYNLNNISQNSNNHKYRQYNNNNINKILWFPFQAQDRPDNRNCNRPSY